MSRGEQEQVATVTFTQTPKPNDNEKEEGKTLGGEETTDGFGQ